MRQSLLLACKPMNDFTSPFIRLRHGFDWRICAEIRDTEFHVKSSNRTFELGEIILGGGDVQVFITKPGSEDKINIWAEGVKQRGP